MLLLSFSWLPYFPVALSNMFPISKVSDPTSCFVLDFWYQFTFSSFGSLLNKVNFNPPLPLSRIRAFWILIETDWIHHSGGQASLVAQLVKNPPAMHETWVRSLGWQDPLEDGMAIHSSIVAWRIPMDRSVRWATVHGVAKRGTWLKRLSMHACKH